MGHMLQENLGLVLPRRVEVSGPWQHILVTSYITEHVAVSLKTIDYLFPLYRYPQTEEKSPGNPHKKSFGNLMFLFDPQTEYQAKKPNISTSLLDQLKKSYKKTPSPEQILFYVYAVLYSKKYRTKYEEFLKMDFPRIPFTAEYSLFLKAVQYGQRLVDLHLLKASELDPPTARFQGQGEAKVEKPQYDRESLRVYINKSCYFEGVPEEVWEYPIGGYQVCDKWLKDRKGRVLQLDEIKQYCQMVTALKKTIEVQKELDTLFERLEKKTIGFES